MSLVRALAAAAACFVLLTSAAEARSHHRHHRRHARCDGVHGCLCGVTAARLNGLSLNYKGANLKEAIAFKRVLTQIAAPVPGAIVYQTRRGGTGHVATIRQVLDRCTAVVQDDRGTYERHICGRGATYLAVNG